MGRAIFLQRPSPTEEDLISTASAIISQVGNDYPLQQELAKLARSYNRLRGDCTKGNNFYGLRDFYQLVKFLDREMKSKHKRAIDFKMLKNAVCRNFGGTTEDREKNVKYFAGITSSYYFRD